MPAEETKHPRLGDRPICWICKRKLESITMWKDDFERKTKFRVECHGQQEECDLPDYGWIDWKISMGYAFKPKTIIYVDLKNRKRIK